MILPRDASRNKPLWRLETDNILAGIVFGDTWVTAALVHIDRRNGTLFPIRWSSAEIATSPTQIPALPRIREAVELCWSNLCDQDAPEYSSLTVCLPPWCCEGEISAASRRIGANTRMPWRRESKVDESDIAALQDAVILSCTNKRFAIADLIPRWYTLDTGSRVDDPRGAITETLELSAFVIRCESGVVYGILDILAELGLRVDGLTSPFAATAAMLSREERDAGAALIDMDRRTTCCSLYLNGALTSCAVVGGGSETIMHRAADSLRMSASDLRAAIAQRKELLLFADDTGVSAHQDRPRRHTPPAPAVTDLDAAADIPASDLFTQIMAAMDDNSIGSPLRKLVLCGDDPLALRAIKRIGSRLADIPSITRQVDQVHAGERFDEPGYARLMGMIRQQAMKPGRRTVLDRYNESLVGTLTRSMSGSARRAYEWMRKPKTQPEVPDAPGVMPTRATTATETSTVSTPSRRTDLFRRSFGRPDWVL